jgi:hypothetical protein
MRGFPFVIIAVLFCLNALDGFGALAISFGHRAMLKPAPYQGHLCAFATWGWHSDWRYWAALTRELPPHLPRLLPYSPRYRPFATLH